MDNIKGPKSEEEIIDGFLETWGSMGSFWGINRSVARVHGLLLVTKRSWTLDEIVDRLKISKGNASTCLKELRAWNVVRKTMVPGERKEYFTSEPDAWQMFFSIMRERKRREFDPIVARVRETADLAAAGSTGIAADRLLQLKGMMGTLDALASRFLASEKQAMAIITFLEGKM